jgi:hypothetical protein
LRAVGEPGQRIVAGGKFQLLFLFAQGGDIADEND